MSKEDKISVIAIDEAHLIASWKSFRYCINLLLLCVSFIHL